MVLVFMCWCQVSAWCPVEDDARLSLQEPVLPNTEKFTVYLKNAVAFPYFGPQYRKNNILGAGRPSLYHQQVTLLKLIKTSS